MKKQIILFIAVIFVAVIFWWWWVLKEPQTSSFHSEKISKESEKLISKNEPQRSESEADAAGKSPLWTDGIDYNDPENWWKAPIEFYGKVVDQNNQAVSEADIRITWTDQSPTGQSELRVQSDQNGLFSIKSIRGYQLGVHVNKERYYTSSTEEKYFRFAGLGETFIPNSSNPVIFHLKRKGEAAELVKQNKSFLIPKDGTPVEISLLTGKVVHGGQGDIKIECWTMDQGFDPIHPQPYDWRSRLSVPGGGMIETTEEYPSNAPEAGYQPFTEIYMPAALGRSWTDSAMKQYYLRLRDGNYARIAFKMMAHGNHGCRIVSFLNPDKSRNLEYDKRKEIQVQ